MDSRSLTTLLPAPEASGLEANNSVSSSETSSSHHSQRVLVVSSRSSRSSSVLIKRGRGGRRQFESRDASFPSRLLTGFMFTSNNPHSLPSTRLGVPLSLLLLASILIGAQAPQASAMSSHAAETSPYDGSSDASSGVITRELAVTASTPL